MGRPLRAQVNLVVWPNIEHVLCAMTEYSKRVNSAQLMLLKWYLGYNTDFIVNAVHV